MKLIVGLGNPGAKYEKTRHNAGFKAVEFLEEHFSFDSFKEVSKHKSQLSEGQIEDEKIILAKPQMFMNLSGQAVRSLLQFYKLELSDLIVIYDDVAIGSGSVRIRPDGSAGGHNGIKSLIQELGSSAFLRVRLGIAPLDEFKGDLEAYVLGRLSDEEVILLTGNLKKLPEIVSFLLKGELEKAMHEYN